MSMRLPPIGFWSYARQDDESSRGRLSSLRSLLQSELQQQYGRDPIQIFQDVSAIPPGGEWRELITEALGNTTFFIPIVTPAFIQSQFCCEEFMIFLERERELRGRYPPLRSHSRIFPISYLSIENIGEAYDPRVLEELNKRQSLDFINLRLKDYQQEAVSLQLATLAARINQLLSIRVEEPSDEPPPPPPPKPRKPKVDQARIEAARLEANRLEAERLEAEAARLAALAKKDAEPTWKAHLEKARPWARKHWRILAAAAAALVVAVLFLGRHDGTTPAQLAKWGLSEKDWSAAYNDALFSKSGMPQRLDEVRAAADKEDPVAKTLLGVAYDYGTTGVNQDANLAHAILLANANAGDARAQVMVGDHYYEGKGVPARDHVEALRWYRLAAAQNNAFGQGDIAFFYSKGLGGLTQDDKEALRWYKKAADQGLTAAEFYLAEQYEQGKGTKVDQKAAATYYKRAADKGYIRAQTKMGAFHAGGLGGLPRDDAESLRYYRMAAASGSGKAAYALGRGYADGSGGLARNDGLALELCRKAVAATFDQAGPEAGDCVNELIMRTAPQSPTPTPNYFTP